MRVMTAGMPAGLAVALGGLLWLSSGGDAVTASETAPAAVSAPEGRLDEGLKAYRRGAFEEAAVSWTEASRLFEQAGRRGEQGEALIRLSQAYQGLGLYNRALQSLQAASALIGPTGDRLRLAEIRGTAGMLYQATGQVDDAEKQFGEGLQLARDLGNQDLAASILNNLGNLLASKKQYQDAVAAYTESLSLARAVRNDALAAGALVNAAILLQQGGRHEEARERLDQAIPYVRSLGDSHDKASGLVTIGLAYGALRPFVPAAAREALTLRAHQVLSDAATVAETIGNARDASYAWGHLGALYETERRYEEALDLTRRAVLAAQQAVAPESLYRWYWQSGRVLKSLGRRDEAILAHRRAVEALQAIRQELLLVVGGAPSSFRDAYGPLYFELAELLLQRAATQQPDHAQKDLVDARDTIELFKVSELRDYFRDECVDAARSLTKGIETVAPSAAVVYPIILPDRTELLVTLKSGLKQVSVPVPAADLIREVRLFRKKLEKRTTREYLPHAQQLYDWLIRPLEPTLASMPIDTLVFVPDGALRTIPMAALHDGRQFLINRFAVAVTPGLTLTDPRPLKRRAVRALSGGLTESVRNFPPLPNVSEELDAVTRLYPGTLLLNKDFLVPRMEQELKEGRFSIVHIASHGQFDSDVRKTFILAFDDKLTMDELAAYIGFFRFREEPLELLTLSACQTAAGDDRAALGLAGVAIKAGARSALATLWFINDQASSALVSEFYRQLQDSSVSKAVALQRAQVKMLDEPAFDHPAYWAPFLLLNNWL